MRTVSSLPRGGSHPTITAWSLSKTARPRPPLRPILTDRRVQLIRGGRGTDPTLPILAAGENWEYQILGIVLGPGTYEIQVTYRAWSAGLIPDAEDDLKTRVHRFQVEE